MLIIDRDQDVRSSVWYSMYDFSQLNEHIIRIACLLIILWLHHHYIIDIVTSGAYAYVVVTDLTVMYICERKSKEHMQ